jgi:hypothetical protein
MAYVPGYSNDVFLSYAHGDDPAWIQAFEQALSRAVRGRLGHEISIWQDLKRLRVGNDWQAEISEAISKTAAFVAVLSPSYQTSDWCSRELRAFIGPRGALDDIKAGDIYRLLKIVKIPWENKDHEAFFPRLQHVSFFRAVDGPQEYFEYPLASDAFLACLQETAAAIAALLRGMRRSLQMVYVASPADDVVDAWNRVRTQLADDRYDVRPDGRLNAGFDDKIILRDMEKAVLTVHLLGSAYDAFAERQIALASEAGRRQLIWFAKGTDQEDQVDPQQWKLLESIRKKEGQPSMDWFPGTVQEMITQVQSALRPRSTPALPDAGGSPRVYLIYDPTTKTDAAFVESLQVELREKEKLDIVVPPSGMISASDFHERHRQQLQSSDGVLLYCNAAPETWFEQYARDVLFPGKKARARSKAFLLDDPSQIDDELNVPVIRRSAEFRVSDLEPFLQPLRAHEVRSARV